MTISTPSTTLSAWLGGAKKRLAASGVESPGHDAKRIAAFGLGTTWSGLWTRLREPVDADASVRLEDLLVRRADGEPLAYVLGTAEFCGHVLEVGPGVLVPRPETEVLVDVAMRLLAGTGEPVVVDVGTGSGAVAIAIATMRPDAFVLATDSSRAALSYARRNVAGSAAAVGLIEADLLAPLADHRADLVVCNPPYVASGTSLPRDVMREPHEAFYAGPAGDDVLVRLVADARRVLCPGGSLAVEVGTPAQAARVRSRLAAWCEWGVRADHSGRVRVVWGRLATP